MKNTVIQFGTGNFLRGFFDYFIDSLNKKGLYDGKIVIVKPTKNGNLDDFEKQNNEYNLYLRGIINSKEICEHTTVNSISKTVNPYSDFEKYIELAGNPDFRFIVSNTTEAGIEFDANCKFSDSPALSFPGKLTQLLFERFKRKLPGFIILPCELIDNNADKLKEYVIKYAKHWNLGEEFILWTENENKFCNTLVDRIVTGYPKNEAQTLIKEIGYDDKLIVTAEIYHLWVIEGNFENELPLSKAGFNVIWTNDVTPYKKMKVRILNGAHTSTVFPALLSGIETVGECLADKTVSKFLDININKYILPVLDSTEEIKSFASSVVDRFSNPYIHHQLKSIALNSASKFSVRVLPTMIDYYNLHGEIPKTLSLSFAALIAYYKNNEISDNEYAVNFIKNNNIKDIVSNEKLWNGDYSVFAEETENAYCRILNDGIQEAIKWALS